MALEVKYTKGLVYLDRCGSTATEIENVLGPSFKASVPDMRAAEIKSEPERLTIRFGPESFSVQHDLTNTAIRLIEVAGVAWKVVAERLGVGRNVSRVGVRLFFIWPTGSVHEAGESIVRSPYMNLSNWQPSRGTPIDASFVAVSQIDAERKARIAAAGIRIETNVDDFSDRLRRFFPKFALQVDTDVYSDTMSNIGPGQLRDFARSAAEWAKSASIALGNEILAE